MSIYFVIQRTRMLDDGRVRTNLRHTRRGFVPMLPGTVEENRNLLNPPH